MSHEDEAEKEHDPSQRKLDEARRRGEVARSADLGVAAGYGGLLAVAAAGGAASLSAIGGAGMVLLDQAEALAPLVLAGGSAPAAGFAGAVALAAAPWFAAPALLVLAALFAQRALIFAPEKLRPRLSRIDPIATAKQKFGRNGLFEFAKSFAKLVLIAALLGWFMAGHLPHILAAQHLDPALATALLLGLVRDFLFLVLVTAAVLGAADYLWQHFEHRRRNRMSRKELTDEMKESEGDPHVKGRRRQRAWDIATNRMLAEVPQADVVIVNPTHYAVALKWRRGSRRAPVCLAKGTDEVAARIRAAAAGAGVPIHSDPPTARALHASVQIGREILPEHYRAVAAAIRFAERMRRRARERRGG